MLEEREYRRFYNQLFNTFDDIKIIFVAVKPIFDKQGNPFDFLYANVNQTFARLLGKSKQQIVGKTSREILGNVTDRIHELLCDVVTSGNSVHFQDFSRALNKHFDVFAWKATNNQIAVFATDITESKKKEQELKKQAMLINLSPDAELIRTIEGTITFWSIGAKALYGYTKKEALGKIAQRLLKTKFPIPLSKIIDRLKKVGKWEGELIHLTKDGREVTVKSRWLRVELDQNQTSIFESNIDITENKKIEQQLQERERLAAIGQTARMVGHDIRNPLQAIIGDVYLLKDYLTNMADMTDNNPMKPDVTESLESIEKNIGYINKIVADLQDYVRQFQPEIKTVNLYNLIVEIFASLNLPENIEMAIELDHSLMLKSDPALLQRIITNLVINAIDAMPNGGKLSIGGYRNQNKFRFIVEDTGVGIPDGIKPKLFTPMMTTKAKGQGLGLVVVKRLVEAMNGSVTCESKIGRGTKFIIVFSL